MERLVTVAPDAGLHARPASKFVETANEYDCDLQIGTEDGPLVNARSMLDVTGLNVPSGETVRLIAEGEASEAALDALEAVVSTAEVEE